MNRGDVGVSEIDSDGTAYNGRLGGDIADDRSFNAAVQLTVGPINLPPDTEIVGDGGVAKWDLQVILGHEPADVALDVGAGQFAEQDKLGYQIAASIRLARTAAVERRRVGFRVIGDQFLQDRCSTSLHAPGKPG